MHRRIFLLFSSILFSFHSTVSQSLNGNDHALLFDPPSLTIAVGYNKPTTIQLVSEQDEPVPVSFVYGENRELNTTYIEPLAPVVFPRFQSPIQIVLNIRARRPGRLIIGCNATPVLSANLTERDFLRVNIARSSSLNRLISVVGWLYFAAWSFSFYPQILLNFKRQSVVGLHFDFLALNFLGFFCYSVFNVGLYSSHEIQNAYFKSHPYGINPVLINDVVFGLHGFIASLVTIFQCLFFERSKQRVSHITSLLLVVFVLFLGISTIISLVEHLHPLLLLYFYSYVKLAISCIKYIPQVVMNFRRKSTEGWSIGNILLDLIGGILSLIQMILLAFNYNDWSSLFGSLTKFGLGIVSIGFDLIFIIQHYILYKTREQQPERYQPLDDHDETPVNI